MSAALAGGGALSAAVNAKRRIGTGRARAARRRIRAPLLVNEMGGWTAPLATFREWGGWTAPPLTPRFTLGATTVPTSSAVGDSKDRAGVIVGDQQRAVLHLPRVDGATPAPPARRHAPGDRLDFRPAPRRERPHHAAEPVLLRAFPRAALREEHPVLVLWREHRAGVELHAVARHVRSGLQQRCSELA